MTFLEEFFGTGNKLRFEDFGLPEAPTPMRARLQPFLRLHDRRGPLAILPRVHTALEKTEWYFLCRTPADRRWARDLLRAFVGASFLTELNRERRLDVADSIDAAVLRAFGDASFAVPVAASMREKVTPRLERLARLLTSQPERGRGVVRPTGSILREFELALQARDGVAATECIASLREGQRLGVQNLEFLEIRRDVAVSDYAKALASPRFETYCEIGFPRRVVAALLEAVWEKELAHWAANRPPAEVVARFSSEIQPRYGALLRTRAGLKGPGIAPLFLLDAVASEPFAPSRIEDLVHELAGGEWRTFAAGVAALVPTKLLPAQPPASNSAALDAFQRGEVDSAYQLALDSPPSFERTLLLLRCAREMDTFVSASSAIDALEKLPAAEKARFDRQKPLSRLLADLHAALLGVDGAVPDKPTEVLGTIKQFPQDWIAWLERLTKPEEWVGAVKAAEKGQREWQLEVSLSDPASIERMTNLIESTRPEWGEVAFRDSEPFLIYALEQIEVKGPIRPVVGALYLHMATDNDSRVVWSAMVQLFDLELGCGGARWMTA